MKFILINFVHPLLAEGNSNSSRKTREKVFVCVCVCVCVCVVWCVCVCVCVCVCKTVSVNVNRNSFIDVCDTILCIHYKNICHLLVFTPSDNTTDISYHLRRPIFPVIP